MRYYWYIITGRWMSLQWMSPRWMSVQWMPLQCNGCHCKWISRQWMSFDGCHISQQRESHRKEISQHRGLIEGCLEVKLPTIWTDGKAQVGRVREEKKMKEDQKRESLRRKKIQVGTSRSIVFFEWFVAPEGWKVGLLKRRVRSHLVR